MSLRIGATAAEIGVGQQADIGILLKSFIEIGDVPGTPGLGRAVLGAEQVAGIVIIDILVDGVVSKQCEFANFPLSESLDVVVVVGKFSVLIGDGVTYGKLLP